MNNNYKKPLMTIVNFSNDDVITTSSPFDPSTPDANGFLWGNGN